MEEKILKGGEYLIVDVPCEDVFTPEDFEKHRVNHEFREGVADLLTTKKQHRPTDFISVAKAQQQILSHTGRNVSHSTAARWVAQNNLGHKLPGHKGEWIVDGVLFSDYLSNRH